MGVNLTEDDDERERFIEALGNGIRYSGYVVIKRRVLEDIRKHLGMTQREFLDRLFSHLRRGGRLAKVDENRDLDFVEFCFEFHHDLWPELRSRAIYVETCFKDAEKLDDRKIFVVSVHPPNNSNWQ